MANELYISEYLKRIGVEGKPEPSLATLQLLQRQHIYSIVFENLNLLRKDFTPNLSREYLFDKLVHQRRGGVCYELNTSFFHLLSALGFSVCQISGRCIPNTPVTGHVFTLVHLPEGDYTADVGYADAPVPPMKIGGEEVVQAYHSEYWLERKSEDWFFLYERRRNGQVKRQYEFFLTPRTPQDCIDVFRYTATPGNSPFTERPICCRFTSKGRIILRRGTLTVEENGIAVRSFAVASGEETDQCLREYFDLP